MSKPEVPIIVAKTNFLSQSAPLGLTTLFTPTDNGVYRLTIVMQDQPSGDVIGFTLSWADSSGSVSVGLVPNQGTTGYSAATAPFFAVAGTAIQIQANFGSNFSYNLYTVLEEL